MKSRHLISETHDFKLTKIVMYQTNSFEISTLEITNDFNLYKSQSFGLKIPKF